MTCRSEAYGGDHKYDRYPRAAFQKYSTKTKARVSYAQMALGDYQFIAVHVERERAAVGDPVSAPRDSGADVRIGRAAQPGFAEFAARAAVGSSVREHHACPGIVYYHRPGGGSNHRAGARSDGNAEEPHPVGRDLPAEYEV